MWGWLGGAGGLIFSIICTISTWNLSLTQARSFFKSVVNQLLVRAEEAAIESSADKDANEQDVLSPVFLFVGEVLSRISRRGSTGEDSSLRMEVHVNLLVLKFAFTNSQIDSTSSVPSSGCYTNDSVMSFGRIQ